MAFCGYLKQSTAVDILLGPCIDDTDGKTAETGLTLDVEVSKNGQALANKNDATTPVHDAAGTIDGYYNCELDATDTATLGILTVVAHAAGFLPVRHDYQVVTANWFDTMCSTDQLDVNVTNVAGTAQTANDNGADINEILIDTDTTLDALIKDIPTTAELALRTLPAADYVVVGDTIAGVTLAGTCTTNTDMRGTDSAATEAKQDIIDTNVDTLVTRLSAAKAQALADWINGGRLDLILDIIAADTTTDIPALIATAQSDLDTITGADGVTLATAQGLYAPNKVVPATKAEMDTAHALLATPAQVNTQVLDVLNVDTFAEPGQGAPAATTTLVDKIGDLVS